jgi:hypothetical protein
MQPRYPDVEVQLTGKDSDLFGVIGRVVRAMRRFDVPDAEINKFEEEVAYCGSYDSALQIVMHWVTAY